MGCGWHLWDTRRRWCYSRTGGSHCQEMHGGVPEKKTAKRLSMHTKYPMHATQSDRGWSRKARQWACALAQRNEM
eukprot:6487419-Amphidinium_carterae.2